MDLLVGKLKTVFQRQDKIKIARPIRKAELRLLDIDQSVEDMVTAVASTGGITKSEIRVGPLREGHGGGTTRSVGTMSNKCDYQAPGGETPPPEVIV